MWPFRSTGQHIDELRKKREQASPSAPVAWPVGWHIGDTVAATLAADFSRRKIEIKWVDADGEPIFSVSMRPDVARGFAADVVRAANALGPEPPAEDEAVDITAQVGKEEEGNG